MVECKYRGRVIGWLYPAEDGYLRYVRDPAPFTTGVYFHGEVADGLFR